MRLRDLDRLDNSVKAVVISFDDGDVSNRTVALPLLKERGLAAEFFVTADFVDQPGMLSATQTRELAEAGMGVQSHGCTHRYLEDSTKRRSHRNCATANVVSNRRRAPQSTHSRSPADAAANANCASRDSLAIDTFSTRCLAPTMADAMVRISNASRLRATMSIDEFACLVAWRGIAPRWQRLRFRLLRLPKRILGNRRYERLRSLVLRT